MASNCPYVACCTDDASSENDTGSIFGWAMTEAGVYLITLTSSCYSLPCCYRHYLLGNWMTSVCYSVNQFQRTNFVTLYPLSVYVRTQYHRVIDSDTVDSTVDYFRPRPTKCIDLPIIKLSPLSSIQMLRSVRRRGFCPPRLLSPDPLT